MYKITLNEPFVKFLNIANDDVLANNIRHQLGAYVTLDISSLQKKIVNQQSGRLSTAIN